MFVREIDLKKIILKLKRQKKDSCKMNFPLNHKLRYMYNVRSPTTVWLKLVFFLSLIRFSTISLRSDFKTKKIQGFPGSKQIILQMKCPFPIDSCMYIALSCSAYLMFFGVILQVIVYSQCRRKANRLGLENTQLV